MDIRHVKLPLGMTLVALLITTALSSLLLLTVTELFASQVQITARLTQRIQLQQQLSSVLQLMQKDLRRAGFNRELDQRVVFDQASSSVDVSQPDRLGYIYRVATSGNRQFRQVVYQLSADSLLLICEKYSASPLTITEASQSTQENPCFSLFEPTQIHVDVFEVSAQLLGAASVQRHQISVILGISLVRTQAISETMQFSVVQRNEQG